MGSGEHRRVHAVVCVARGDDRRTCLREAGGGEGLAAHAPAARPSCTRPRTARSCPPPWASPTRASVRCSRSSSSKTCTGRRRTRTTSRRSSKPSTRSLRLLHRTTWRLTVRASRAGSGFANEPEPFLGLGLCSRAWLDASIDALVCSERDASFGATTSCTTTSPRHPLPLRVALQDSCHLRHAQRLPLSSRASLARIPGLEVVEPASRTSAAARPGSTTSCSRTPPRPRRAEGRTRARDGHPSELVDAWIRNTA
jgi:hypothetical protein